MRSALQVDPADAAPIWRQIELGVLRLVASGGFAPGAPVPSVRDLSRQLRVNPATVAKAYQRLSDAGVLTMRRGEGTFVADAPPAMSRAEQRRMLRDAADRYAHVAVTLGASRDAALDEVGSALGRLERANPRGETR